MCAAERHEDGVTAARLVALLTAFKPGDNALGVSELARRTALAKSSVYRLAGHLVATGLLEREGTSVRLGLKLFEIGQLAVHRGGLVDSARPFLADLREATHNTAHLAILEGPQVVYLDVLRGSDAPSLPSRIGGRFPAHATGVGKAILAFSPDSLIEKALAGGLPRVSSRTVSTPGLLRRQLVKVRADGVAYDREESGTGVVCVASPVLDGGGRPLAAISLSGWSNRMRTDRTALAVRTAALALSRVLK